MKALRETWHIDVNSATNLKATHIMWQAPAWGPEAGRVQTLSLHPPSEIDYKEFGNDKTESAPSRKQKLIAVGACTQKHTNQNKNENKK